MTFGLTGKLQHGRILLKNFHPEYEFGLTIATNDCHMSTEESTLCLRFSFFGDGLLHPRRIRTIAEAGELVKEMVKKNPKLMQ